MSLAISAPFLLAITSIQSRALSVAYFLSGALIALVPIVLFGALLVFLYRIYKRSEGVDG